VILRHLEKDDWVRVPTLPHFDGFVFQSGQEDSALRGAATALATTKAGYLYAQVLTRPDPTWGNPTGAPWLDVVNALTTPLKTPSGVQAVAWAHGRPLIDWHALDGGKLDGLTDALVNEVRALGLSGALLDLSFARPRDWMFRYDGPAYSEFPANWWPYWERRFRKFVQLLGAKFAAASPERPSPLRILLEGDEVVIQIAGSVGRAGFYREQAQLNWAEELHDWGVSGGVDVLSVLADDTEAMYALVAASRTRPEHWIAFTGHSATAVDEAYELAAEVQDEPPMPSSFLPAPS
jgi:hypothetical protein